jgi:cytochrome c peroxidase
MSLVNVAYAQALTWTNPSLIRLEEQALVPMYGDAPIELGLDRSEAWLGALSRDSTYQRLFGATFDGSATAITAQNVVRALATFQRTIVSARSP